MVTIMGTMRGEKMEKIMELGQRLRQLMEERKWNYEELGQYVGMRPQTLNRYVLGQRDPKGQVVAELAMKLGVDPLWLQGYDVPRQRERAPEKAGQVPVYRLLSGIEPLDTQPPEGYAHCRPAQCGRTFLPAGHGVRHGGCGDPAWRSGAHPPAEASARSGQIALVAFAGRPAVLRWYYQQGESVILHQPERGCRRNWWRRSSFAAAAPRC